MITATYFDDLSRVRVDFSGAPIDADSAIVERSTDGVTWAQVRGGDKVAVTGSAGSAGLSLQSIVGAYAYTPDAPSLNITGDIDVRIEVTPDTWSPGTWFVLAAKYLATGTNRAWMFNLLAGGALEFSWSPDGTFAGRQVRSSTASIPANSGRLALRATLDVDDGAGNHVVRFYMAPSMAGPWAQLGADVTVPGATSIPGTTAKLSIGAGDDGTSVVNPGVTFSGLVHGFELRNGIGGTVVANPVFSAGITGTSFTDGAGRPWTLAGSARIASRGAGHLDDYEFTPGVPNTYRVSYVNTGPMSMVTAAGVAVTGNNTSLTPAIPGGVRAGDLLLCYASIRNTAAFPNAIPGWTAIVDLGNAGLYARRYVPGDANPTVTFTGGATGDDTMAQVTAFHNAELFPQSFTVPASATAQNITLPGITVTQPATLDVWLAWKQNAWTSATSGRGFAKIGDWPSTAGSGASMWWEYTVQGPTNKISFLTSTLTVTGGTSALGKGASVVFRKADWIIQESTVVTPTMSVVWLKNPRRPNLNTKITVTDWSTITRPARAGTFGVIGRTMPISVTDVRGSRQYTLTVTTKDLAAAEDLDARLAQGDPILLHVPSTCPFPGGYFVVGDIAMDRHSKRTLRRFFDLPLTEVAAPANSIYSQTATYADIAAAYASYGDVILNEPWYSDVLDYIAPVSDIITS